VLYVIGARVMLVQLKGGVYAGWSVQVCFISLVRRRVGATVRGHRSYAQGSWIRRLNAQDRWCNSRSAAVGGWVVVLERPARK
jgi:hypothetical protein